MKPTHLDLFSGIGGFAIAAQNCGFETVGFSEIEPYACKVLKKHWPDIPNYGDIRTVPTIKCDLLTGGFPCQPFSVAGKRRGEADDRYLWPAMLDAIRRCKPVWVLGENVANFQNMGLARCCDDLEEAGYQPQALDIPSCAVGLQTLERHIWIVASRRGSFLERGCAMGIPCEQKELQVSNGRQVCYGATNYPRLSTLSEPKLLRSRKGVSNFVDRMRGIGNAIVPQVAEEILRGIASLL